jgi:ABC-type antimicrobial peptide transport system permease subunit
MRYFDLFDAVRVLFVHRMRAFLTMLGVVIGTSAIVMLASLLDGGERFLVAASQEATGDDLIEVRPDEAPSDKRGRTQRGLTRGDADALKNEPQLKGASVAGASSFDTWARYAERRKRVAIVSAGAETARLYRLRVLRGRPLDEDDENAGSRVCVVGHEIYEELLASLPLGQLRVEISGGLFEVVGVLEKKPMLDATDSTRVWGRRVLVPEKTYDALYATSHEVSGIFVRSERDPSVARQLTRAILLRRHYGIPNFALVNEDESGIQALIMAVIRVLLVGTGVLALFASGINIMNVMLVTVSERTPEIGVRRALGATRLSILVQFVCEACALTLIATLFGLLCGACLAWGTACAARWAVGSWEQHIPLWSCALAFGLALVTGALFGLFPALRASRISPFEALRSA